MIMNDIVLEKDVLEKIKSCFLQDKVYYTKHAKEEMKVEKFGRIYDNEVMESILNGEVIKSYFDDKPYPSFLIFGKTNTERPIHIVCSYLKEEDVTIVITVYEPDKEKWINYKERRK